MNAGTSLPLTMGEPATEGDCGKTLQQLQSSEALLQVIANNVAELIAVVNSDGRRIWNNAAYAERLGYQPDELKGSDSMEEIHPDDLNLVRETFEISMREGVGRRIEYRMRRKDGGWIFLESEGRVAHNWNGHERCLVLVARDITARRQKEREKQQRAQLHISRAEALGTFTTSEDLQRGDLEKCFATAVEIGVELSGFERVGVWTMDETETRLELRKRSGAGPTDLAAFNRLGNAGFFGLLKREILIAASTLAEDDRLREIAPFFLAEGTTGLLIVPLRRGTAVLGALICERTGKLHGWHFDEASFAKSLAHGLVLAIDSKERLDAYNRLDESQKQLSNELRKASAYVESRLPARLEGEVDTDWRFLPSEVLGGDAFGYYWLDPDHLAIYLLDVVDHGVRAALVSVAIMNELRGGFMNDTDLLDPRQVLMALNKTFQMDEQDGMYFTLWYGIYDKPRRQLRYASAGHPPALLFPKNSADPLLLHTPGLMIGAIPGAEYEAGFCHVEPGSRLYVFSDGVYEVEKESGGTGTLRDMIESFAAFPDDNLDHLVASARAMQGPKQSSFTDDFSVVKLVFR